MRFYQQEAIASLRAWFGRGRKEPALAVLPTGSGKSLILADIAKRATSKGNRALVVTHVAELVEQNHAKLSIEFVDLTEAVHAFVVLGAAAAVGHTGSAPIPGASDYFR